MIKTSTKETQQMLVQKFGGSSLADIDGFIAAADIISGAAASEKVVVVLSAMYGVTDLLENAIKAAISGDDYKSTLWRVSAKKSRGILQEMQKSSWTSPHWRQSFLQIQRETPGVTVGRCGTA